ncbi:hypothetical protein RJ639_026354 [Escallonia herrerae]|uniref:Shugoshin C-terminal domain-containing protein n=1 Tax=Escallonia herrerae TaxID=1293975 RepID=A0AA88RVU4_9ASTE|nr:hypothetical protein RJ639_026354 [Escallonia herrerae]
MCVRRQSVRLSGKLNPTGDLFETSEAKLRDETKAGQNYGQEVEVTKHADTEEPLETGKDDKQLFDVYQEASVITRKEHSLGSKVPFFTENFLYVVGLGPSTVEQIQDRDQVEEYVRPKTRQNLDDEVEVTKHDESGESSEIGLGPSAVTGIQEEQAKGKRTRRQSARFMSEGPKPTEDSFETDDTKFPLWPLRDDQVQEDSLTSTSACFEDQCSSVPCYQTAESRRSSFGRPLRQAAKKVQTYKEIPVNLKMRRDKIKLWFLHFSSTGPGFRVSQNRRSLSLQKEKESDLDPRIRSSEMKIELWIPHSSVDPPCPSSHVSCVPLRGRAGEMIGDNLDGPNPYEEHGVEALGYDR